MSNTGVISRCGGLSPSAGMMRQENQEFKTSLGYISELYFKRKPELNWNNDPVSVVRKR